MFQSVVLLQILLLNPIQGLQHLMQGVSIVVSVCLGWLLPDWMPSRRNQPIQTKQVKIGLSFLLFLLKHLWGGAGFYICWFTCPGSPEHEKLMTKCWKDIMVTSCGVGERKLVLMLMDFAMLIKLWKPRPCQDVRVCWTEVKHWALISCSCMLRVSSFSSFTDVFFSSFWLVWCRYKTTKPWEFLQREPSVSICFRVISWQWCLPVNRSHKFKEGRKKKKDRLSWVYWSPYLQQFWNLANHWCSINLCLLNTYSTYWTILIQSLKPELMLWSESFRKTSTMLLMAQVFRDCETKMRSCFLWILTVFAPLRWSTEFFKKYFSSQQNSSWEYTGGPSTRSNREGFGCLAIGGKLWTGFDQNTWNHN